MRVNPNNIYGPAPASTQNAGRTERSNGYRGADSADSAYDQTEISSDAMLLNRVLSKSASERAQRVSELQGLVSSGAYAVDSAALGRSMVQDMLAARQTR